MAENLSSPTPEEQPDAKRLKLSFTTTPNDEQNQENAPTLPRKPRYKRRKVAIFFAFCGVGYQGMQKNPGAKTIEGDLEEALYLSGAVPEQDRGQPRRYEWARSARTDKGVSAVGQVVSGRFYVDPPGFVERLNSNLASQIRIFGYKRVTPSFNAKKFCDRRRYVYLIPVFALDPSSHRDREDSSVARDDLDNCFECSERRRLVLESKTVVEAVEVRSGISSNSVSALVEERIDEHETMNIDSERNSSNEGIEVIKADSLDSEGKGNDDGDGGKESDETGKKLENGEEQMKEDELECNANGMSEKKSEFCYGEAERERFNRILKYYEGTHNFHNFTARTKAEDPSAKRYIVSFKANNVVHVDGIDFVKCEVVGQSFMLHQIRKMIGLAVAIMRDCTPESIIETAFEQKENINVPMAPEVGLYLDECLFSSYNKKWKDSHEELSMKAYEEEAEDFKMRHIYSHIASAEKEDGVVVLWLHSLSRHNFRNMRDADNAVISDLHVNDGDGENCPYSDVKTGEALNTDE